MSVYWTEFQVDMDTGKDEDRIRTYTYENFNVTLIAVISHAIVYWISLKLALENPSLKNTDQANIASYKGPVPCIDLAGENKI